MNPLTLTALLALATAANAATIVATGYCPCVACCGAMGGLGITASGAKAKQGITVAASRSIPFGTRVLVNGRTFIVQDRLAARFDSRLDFFFDTHAEALRFGKRTIRVAILPSRGTTNNRGTANRLPVALLPAVAPLAAPSPASPPRAAALGASSRGTGAVILSKSTRRRA